MHLVLGKEIQTLLCKAKVILLHLALVKELYGFYQKEVYGRQSKKETRMHLGLESKLHQNCSCEYYKVSIEHFFNAVNYIYTMEPNHV